MMSDTTQQKRSADVPLIDLGEIGLEHKDEPSEEEWQRVARQMYDAFTTLGCAYLIKHGIPKEEMEGTLASWKTFFNLDQDTKNRYERDFTTFQGYVASDTENYDNAHELHEGFTFHSERTRFPDNEVPSVRTNSIPFLKSCKTLAHRLMTTLALSLGLERDYFHSMHKEIKNSSTSIRVNFYPPLSKTSLLPDTTRFGAHNDFTTFTLLFQDDVGGLQTCDQEGQWLDVDPLPNAVLLITGDYGKFYSDDKFLSFRHRVVIPENEVLWDKPRMSMAFFVAPDDETPLKTKTKSSMMGFKTIWEYAYEMMMKPYQGTKE